jgi:atypical dual specificity phosphatase
MSNSLGLWWIIPQSLAGMPAPRFAYERYEAPSAVDTFADDLPALISAGIGAVVCLLNLPQVAPIYRSANIELLRMPIPDGGAPSIEQALEIVAFIDEQRAGDRCVAVHCAAGIGRTGTALAAYLISRGSGPDEAIRRIRLAEPAAIETQRQLQFLYDFATARRTR